MPRSTLKVTCPCCRTEISVSLSVNSKKPKETKRDDSDDPMTLTEFVGKCRESNQRHINLIGEWADEVTPKLTTKGQWRQYVSRNVRTATRLRDFTFDQMAEGMKAIRSMQERADFEPTMETLLKQLTK